MADGPMHDHNRQAERERASNREPGYTPTDGDREMLEAYSIDVAHADHAGWRQFGRCVYCACGARLFQGSLPRSRG